MGLTLREVRDEDLPLLFEQWAVPVAAHMAAFTAPDHMDWDAFERRWSRLRADETVLARVIVVDDDVAGTIGSWGDSGERGDVLDRRDRRLSAKCLRAVSDSHSRESATQTHVLRLRHRGDGVSWGCRAPYSPGGCSGGAVRS